MTETESKHYDFLKNFKIIIVYNLELQLIIGTYDKIQDNPSKTKEAKQKIKCRGIKIKGLVNLVICRARAISNKLIL